MLNEINYYESLIEQMQQSLNALEAQYEASLAAGAEFQQLQSIANIIKYGTQGMNEMLRYYYFLMGL